MYIPQTKDTPEVELSIEECKFKISGQSYYVGIDKLYDKVYKWMNKELPNLNCELNVELYFTMVSSASLKNIIDIFNKLNYFYKIGKKIRITWTCDQGDTDLIDTANDFSKLTKMPFNVVERF